MLSFLALQSGLVNLREMGLSELDWVQGFGQGLAVAGAFLLILLAAGWQWRHVNVAAAWGQAHPAAAGNRGHVVPVGFALGGGRQQAPRPRDSTPTCTCGWRVACLALIVTIGWPIRPTCVHAPASRARRGK